VADSQTVCLAKAVTESLRLAAGDMVLRFTPRRSYLRVINLEDLDVVDVVVTPKNKDLTRSSRKSNSEVHSIDVAVRKHIQWDSLAEADQLMRLVEEIEDHLFCENWFCGFTLMNAEQGIMWDPDNLQDKQVFLSVTTFNFRKSRDICGTTSSSLTSSSESSTSSSTTSSS
jgi:hypothetical protein